MPIYQYVCNECGKKFEVAGSYKVFISYVPTCPECKSNEVEKKMGKVNFMLKGNGWYATDNKKKTPS